MKPLKILYVEDEPDIRSIVTMTLETIGHHVICPCESGMDAITQISGFAPDLVLLDMMMPGMNGVETMEQLRRTKEGQQTPVIFMTAKVQAKEIQDYLDRGAIGVITKPFDPMSLVQDIQKLWQDKETDTRYTPV